ncbi:ATP-binding protein [Methylomonas sp. EFPC1]|uniref:ATP-binding protein n=1 Tax=Methylomonas sp. EFPC1 TaxID=2812647 RepID=UPI0019673DBF|nr:ATP-binding protein [Methylomonas sp. EFPC1]QSA99789.1 ATP-binding protein [Methylomonas sp. EFPC1]
MSFLISAQTIIHLGSDLITSDAVALYELIKNAIDAKSKNGVDVEFLITILKADFSAFLDEAKQSTSASLNILKKSLLDRIVKDAPDDLVKNFKASISKATTIEQLIRYSKAAYRDCNLIIVSDRGHGMSEGDIKANFLTIGASNRKKAVEEAVQNGSSRAPYLGEKGVGRLSAMRLGKKLKVQTATADDKRFNILEIDWGKFEQAYDKPADSIHLEPTKGDIKQQGFESGTKIIISDLQSSWTRETLQSVASDQIARMMDPFSWSERRRFQIRLTYNEQNVDHNRVVAKELLANAHASCIGRYELTDNGPKLTITMESKLYDGQNLQHLFDLTDLISMTGLKDSKQPSSILSSLGPFQFEFYWFNRQRLRGFEGVGDREEVRKLVKNWTGVCLFRDGYRVLPYGDEGDDWLGLDRNALAAGGYKLNTKQIIGRVSIGRTTNSKLLDQTNRQGLIDCPEKSILIELLNNIVSTRLHDYLNEASLAKKSKESSFDAQQASAVINALENRAKNSIRTIRTRYRVDEALLQEVKDAFKEIKDAHEKAVDRINAVEEEKERLTQLAGIGLMTEVIAHELTRATERTLSELKSIGKIVTEPGLTSSVHVLRQQIQVIQKRLKVLDPLTIPSRQRRSSHNLVKIVQTIMESHHDQFLRHKITPELTFTHKDIIAFIIEGHVVQIIENLITNSIYWLDIYRLEHPMFNANISISLLDDPPRVRISDNGPGIPSGRSESVFEPFFSTKPMAGSRRRGLGLFIARQNSDMLGGSLELIELSRVHADRFNTFELILKKEAK